MPDNDDIVKDALLRMEVSEDFTEIMDLIDKDEAEAIILCGRPGPHNHPDSVEGVCSLCGAPVAHRADVPPSFKKVCVDCGIPLLPTADHIGITEDHLKGAVEMIARERDLRKRDA